MRLVLLLLSALLHAGEWVPVEVTATAYCPCRVCCGARAAGLTADGSDVREWPYGIAVDPRWLPYGTPIMVPHGQGYLDQQQPDARLFYADDTGGTIRRRTRATGHPHIDLRFRQHGNAARFGVKTITILVWKE
jgi:3D (Asp-Asp-Asp) domain-containing protein